MAEEPKTTPFYDALTNREKALVDAYLESNFNAAEAARRLGYSRPYYEGSKFLQKTRVQKAIRERLAEYKMSADEVLARMSALSRSDFSDFITMEDGKPKFDLTKARIRGALVCVKQIKMRNNEVESIILHDPVRVLETLTKVHKLIDKEDNETPNEITLKWADS